MDQTTMEKLIAENEIDPLVAYGNSLPSQAAREFENSLITLLEKTGNSSHRNTAALVLSDLHCNRAVDSLITLIKKPENSSCNGTLVYALQTLDCGQRIPELLFLFDSNNFEVQWMLCGLIKEKWNKMSSSSREITVRYLETKSTQLLDLLDLLKDLQSFLNLKDE